MILRYVQIVYFLLAVFPLQAQIHIEEKVKFLALGDSYTIGQSVAGSERWPVQLIDSLRVKGLSCFDPQIIATTGWRTDNLKAAIQRAKLPNDYNLVSLLIGVNNYYQAGNSKTYSKEFEELLEIAITLAGGNKDHVFVVSIPDYGYTSFGKDNQAEITIGINEFNSINKSISQNKGIAYIDITGISRQGLIDPSLVANDGLHPSGKMYTKWTNAILNNLLLHKK